MELCTFAIEGGFAEAIMRGQKLSFLKEDHYSQIKNLTNLQELKAYLEEETDYGTHFTSESTANITVKGIMSVLQNKLADELEYLQRNCINPLNKFIWYLRCPYMIDNVINQLEGIKNRVPQETLDAGAHPIGDFPELKSIKVESDDLTSLYEGVLIDTPISPYFLKF